MSSALPPPSQPPQPGAAADRRREIVLDLAVARKGLLGRLGGAQRGSVRLHGTEITLMHPGAMIGPVTLPGAVVTVATVDPGAAERSGAYGRFPILRRMGPGQVIPREHGIEGWVWTSTHGSALPELADDEAPNLALVFAKPLDEALVRRHFRAEWVRALADRSPLGTPTVPGLLLTAVSAWAAKDAFGRFGVLGHVTDREIPPVMRRHLPGDLPANPVVRAGEDRRSRTSFAPPGAR